MSPLIYLAVERCSTLRFCLLRGSLIRIYLSVLHLHLYPVWSSQAGSLLCSFATAAATATRYYYASLRAHAGSEEGRR